MTWRRLPWKGRDGIATWTVAVIFRRATASIQQKSSRIPKYTGVRTKTTNTTRNWQLSYGKQIGGIQLNKISTATLVLVLTLAMPYRQVAAIPWILRRPIRPSGKTRENYAPLRSETPLDFFQAGMFCSENPPSWVCPHHRTATVSPHRNGCCCCYPSETDNSNINSNMEDQGGRSRKGENSCARYVVHIILIPTHGALCSGYNIILKQIGGTWDAAGKLSKPRKRKSTERCQHWW